MRVRAASLFAAILTAWSLADPAAQQRAQETFRSGRDVLTIDTSVTGPNDAPITDLKAEDFTVRIDGELRPVLTVHRYAAAPATAASDAAPVGRFTRAADAAPGRAVVIVIDRPSLKPGNEKGAVEAAATLINSLGPADAVAAIGLPGGGVDLTRDHAIVADAIKRMTGTQPMSDWTYFMSWDEAILYEREDVNTMKRVYDRECPPYKPVGSFPPPDNCPPALAQQAREMLLQGRSQAQTTLAALTDLLKRLAPLHAAKHMVVLSGGLVFDTDVYSRYRLLAQQAAESHVAMSIVHLDSDADTTDARRVSNIYGGRDYATGLGTVASMTGGSFYMGVGRATGAFQRVASEIVNFYELGVESRPSDADGKAHKVEVTVSRAGAKVRAPSATASPRRAATTAATLEAALAEPTDVAELPLEIATYNTHSTDAEKVSVIVAAQLAANAEATPAEWGYVIVADGKVVGSAKVHVEQAGQPWAASAKVDMPPGRYRLRTAVVAQDGRIGTIDLPLRVGLRQAGTIYASDVVVGAPEGGRLQPRARVRQDESAVGMIELSSGEPLSDVGGEVQLIRGGTAVPAVTRPLRLRTREDDKSIIVAEATLDLTSLAPGPYTASAVIQKGGQPIARVSRVFEIMPGAATTTAPGATTTTAPAAAAAAPAPAPAATVSRDPAVDELMHHVSEYVGRYGRDASVLIGVEHYNQGAVDLSDAAAVAGLQTPSGRGSLAAPGIAATPSAPKTTDQKLVSEIALVQNAAAIGGWLAYRDVIEVNGKAVPDRNNRLQALFRSGAPDTETARKIAAESARYNVGPVTRTFNVPTSALFFFTPANLARFTFQRAGTERIDGIEAWKVDFEETRKPSMIVTATGTDLPAMGTLWINPADGSVLRTRLLIAQTRNARSRAEVEVTYRADTTIGMLIPARMAERYLTSTASITGEATYSDFKRFQTAVTIK
jgi:VWFA-related protein